jgi:hypothetical protein
MNTLLLPIQVNVLEPVDFIVDTDATGWLLDYDYVQPMV